MSKHRSVEYRKVYFKLERRTRKTAAPRAKAASAGQLENEFNLAPPAPSADEILAELEPRPLLTAKPAETGPDLDGRFSLRELILLVTLIAVGLSGMHWLPLRLYAGISGVAALLGLIILSVLKPARLIAHLIWWSVLGIYVFSCTMAAVSGQ